MMFSGIILGAAAFLLIGVFHPLVIKAEYILGKECWWIFALAGVIFCVLSLFVESMMIASLWGVAGFSSFWSIYELFEQEKRVKRGWFPENPDRKDKKDKR